MKFYTIDYIRSSSEKQPLRSYSRFQLVSVPDTRYPYLIPIPITALRGYPNTPLRTRQSGTPFSLDLIFHLELQKVYSIWHPKTNPFIRTYILEYSILVIFDRHPGPASPMMTIFGIHGHNRFFDIDYLTTPWLRTARSRRCCQYHYSRPQSPYRDFSSFSWRVWSGGREKGSHWLVSLDEYCTVYAPRDRIFAQYVHIPHPQPPFI